MQKIGLPWIQTNLKVFYFYHLFSSTNMHAALHTHEHFKTQFEEMQYKLFVSGQLRYIFVHKKIFKCWELVETAQDSDLPHKDL